jgi:putative alpha-1,2-mannosidase
MSGLVPIAGQSVYLILPPSFQEIQWTVTGSRIIVHEFGPENQYIQNVTVDGQPVFPCRSQSNIQWHSNWISHDFFEKGSTMEITVGPEPSIWGTGEDDVPPSLSTGGFSFDA